MLADVRSELLWGLKLTRAERFMLRRRADGMTQREVADLYSVSVELVREWEQGVSDAPFVRGVRVRDLPFGELTYVQRRRRGVRVVRLANVFGRSVGWVHNALRGGPGAERVARFILKQQEQTR